MLSLTGATFELSNARYASHFQKHIKCISFSNGMKAVWAPMRYLIPLIIKNMNFYWISLITENSPACVILSLTGVWASQALWSLAGKTWSGPAPVLKLRTPVTPVNLLLQMLMLTIPRFMASVSVVIKLKQSLELATIHDATYALESNRSLFTLDWVFTLGHFMSRDKMCSR